MPRRRDAVFMRIGAPTRAVREPRQFREAVVPRRPGQCKARQGAPRGAEAGRYDAASLLGVAAAASRRRRTGGRACPSTRSPRRLLQHHQHTHTRDSLATTSSGRCRIAKTPSPRSVAQRAVKQHTHDTKNAGAVNEAVQQVAFSDKILLNKVDLVTPDELTAIRKDIRKINHFAEVIECERCDLGVPRCCGAVTPSTRLVSRNDESGWFLFRV